MRVVAYLQAYPPDRLAGADLMSQVMLQALASEGHEVEVYTMGRGRERMDGMIKVHPGIRAGRLRDVPADLLYTHPDIGTVTYAYAQARRIPLVTVVHNTAPRMGTFLRQGKPTLTVWNSESTKRLLNGTEGIICRPPLRIADHQSNRAGADRITLVNLTAAKGAHLFWTLAEMRPDLRFLGVVGGYGEQAFMHPGLGSLPNVDVVGPVHPSRMAEVVWSRTRVLIAPSDLESWGMAASEALCSGIPVIAHPTPGLLESLGDVGAFVRRENTHEWVEAITSVWDADPAPYLRRASALEAQHREDLQAFVRSVSSLSAIAAI